MPDFRYFKRSEFACKETGENEISNIFIWKLDELRGLCGFPFKITSGYRSPEHSAEVNKPHGPGTHSKGIAADIYCADAAKRFTLLRNAFRCGFTGVGVASTFIHVDTRDNTPHVWTY